MTHKSNLSLWIEVWRALPNGQTTVGPSQPTFFKEQRGSDVDALYKLINPLSSI
jgi:hypothetical protein